MKNLENKVLYILKNYAYTRNDDIALMIKLWQVYYPGFIKGKTVKLEMLHYLPHQGDIQRLRAKIQHDMGKYLPLDSRVALRRNIKRLEWFKYIKGENNGNYKTA